MHFYGATAVYERWAVNPTGKSPRVRYQGRSYTCQQFHVVPKHRKSVLFWVLLTFVNGLLKVELVSKFRDGVNVPSPTDLNVNELQLSI
jgi:hypothetical protein